MTLISVYTHTITHDDCDKETFYAFLHSTVSRVQPSAKLFVLGDFNARVGCEAAAWPGVLGRHGVGNMNSNGLLYFSPSVLSWILPSVTLTFVRRTHRPINAPGIPDVPTFLTVAFTGLQSSALEESE